MTSCKSPAGSPTLVSPLRYISYKVVIVPSIQIVYVILARKPILTQNKTGRKSLQRWSLNNYSIAMGGLSTKDQNRKCLTVKSIRRFILIWFTFLFLSQSVIARNWYVAANGSDTGNGSEQDPFLSIEKAGPVCRFRYSGNIQEFKRSIIKRSGY